MTKRPGLKLLSTLAVMGAMKDLAEAYRARTGIAINAEFAPTVALLEKLRAGEAGDVVILTAQGIDDMMVEGPVLLASRVDVALSFVGVAVKAGAPKPDLSTVAAFRATMLAAESVAYSKIGASGIYFADLIVRLGIAEAVNAKAVIIPMGFTAEKVANGEADLAVQQISELMTVPGIDVVGPFPAEIQVASRFDAAIFTDAANSPGAQAFLRLLTSPAAAQAYADGGLSSRLALR